MLKSNTGGFTSFIHAQDKKSCLDSAQNYLSVLSNNNTIYPK